MDFCRIRDVERPALKETKIILATPIILALPQWVLVLLKRMKYSLRSCGLVRRTVARGARKNVRDADDG